MYILDLKVCCIKPVLEREKRDPIPLVRWTASCRATRIIALSGPEVYGVTVAILPESDEKVLHYARRLRDEVGKLSSPHVAAEVALIEFAQQDDTKSKLRPSVG